MGLHGISGGLAAAVVAVGVSVAGGQVRPANVPVLSSRAGAPYTLYLNFAGFEFTGLWMGRGTPGATLAYFGATGAFSAEQQGAIANVWARVAEKFAPFNVNVTTVDPAAGALGAGATDAQRQAYYDSTARVMHTVIGGTGSWLSNSGTGNSAIGSTRTAYVPAYSNGGAGSGYHTNWVFAGQSGMTPAAVGEVAAHEHGHGLSLSHQCDCQGGVVVNAYASNFGASGAGSYSAVMGTPFFSQRATWRVGTVNKNGIQIQNDVRSIVGNLGMGGFVEDGIGHSVGTATALPLVGANVDPGRAKGVIVPVSAVDPNPLGVGNYTRDYSAFRTDGAGAVMLTVNNGGSRLAAGVADPGVTLNSRMRILDGAGNVVGVGEVAGSTLSSTYVGVLPAGRYVAEVASAGGHVSLGDPTAVYYDMGSFFLTGDGFSSARWVGASRGVWEGAGNWLGGAVPAASEEAVVPAGVTVTTTGVRQDVLTVGGTVSVASVKEGGRTSRVGVLNLAGTIDLADTRMVVAGGGAEGVREQLRTGYAGGTWEGVGIRSSNAAADRLGVLAIGYATAGQLGVTSWDGVDGLTGAEVVTRLTVFGDANLDGVIGADDFALVDRGLRGGLSGWIFGDFDYSGGVDLADAWLMHRGYLLQTDVKFAGSLLAGLEAQYGKAYVESLAVSIPEPGGVGGVMLMLWAGGMVRRRR